MSVFDGICTLSSIGRASKKALQVPTARHLFQLLMYFCFVDVFMDCILSFYSYKNC